MDGSASQAGFYYQNNIAALKILECLFFETDITHVRLENYEKGYHIDDIIVYRNGKTDYFQIKWSEDGETAYTLYNLLTSQAPKKSIFRQLAEGYLSVSGNGGDFSITLLTTKRESSQKRPAEGVKHSLTELRINIFEPLKRTATTYDSFQNYSAYQETLEKIRTECGLDKNSFNDFLKKLEFQFSQPSIEQINRAIRFRLDSLGIEESKLEKLLDGVVNWSITGEVITKASVLKQLGIADRFEDKLSHYFKTVEDKFYVPNNELSEKLEASIKELPGGYIFIEGLPGIGKSTALTKFREAHPKSTLAYYCFIPDAGTEFGSLRHKVQYFTKSLCISIEKQFAEVNFPLKYSEKFDEKLNAYIDKLASLNKKILFIIDGLDHVHRNTSVQADSLLGHINGALPPNIYFLLSSQYKSVLSPAVAAQIEADKRRHIIVDRFKQSEIRQYLTNKGIEARKHLDTIEQVSSGIPLYLHYISELLLKTESKDYEDVLDSLPILTDGKINEYHEYLFAKIEDNEFAKWVLAALAHRKENSSAETVVEILELAGLPKSVADVQDVFNNFSHLLRQTNGRAYNVFHNSFREFILSKTSHLRHRFNAALVCFYEQNSNSDEAYRNYFKHLFEVGEYGKIAASTSMYWMKTAWRNLRSADEIEENLEIALKACVENTMLSEFVRIAFLKAQFGKLSWTLENCDIDFPTLLLNAGERANSLRLIWDGDFVLVNKRYFCSYLGHYYRVTGNLLPHDVLQQGFSKALKEQKAEDITTELKAKALAFGHTKEMFDEIDMIKWVHSNEYSTDYHRENFTDEQNADANLKIKLEIVQYLYEHKQYRELMQLSQAFETNQQLSFPIRLALIKLLLPTDKVSGMKLFRNLDISSLPYQEYIELTSFCSEFLTNEEIIQLFPKREMVMPLLHSEVIDKKGISYGLHNDIVSLYATLKPIWIFSAERVNQLMVRVSAMSNPAKRIYDSIFYLSELWNKSRVLNLTDEAKLNLAKLSIKALFIPRRIEFRQRNYGLFDMNNDHYFIAGSIANHFKDIFGLAAKILSANNFEELVKYWLQLEENEDGFVHYKTALQVAIEINKSQHKNFRSLKRLILTQAEEIARSEEETGTLTSYLGDVAEAYGICGFPEDFRRIYNQLVEVSFGVGSRKDYQASYILSPLELLHKTDPGNTLQRLAEVLAVQKKLANAGNPRMLHICLSELIGFAAEHFPELAFILFEQEEKHLGREEAVDIIFVPVIKHAPKGHLLSLLAIIKTLPRWDKGDTRDNHFLNLALVLLRRAVQFEDKECVADLIEIVKQNLTVELNNPNQLEKFSEIFAEAGKDYAKYSLPHPNKETKPVTESKKRAPDKKFLMPYSATALSELIDLFERDYFAFKEHIQIQFEVCLQNRRIQTLRNEYYRSKSTFEKFYASLPDDVERDGQKIARKVIKKFVHFSRKVAALNPGALLSSSELEKLFDDFVTKTDTLFPANALSSFVENEFEKERWIDNILQFINNDRDYVFSNVISNEDISRVAEQVSILQAQNLLDFIDNRTTGQTHSVACLTVANRLLPIDPQMAQEILVRIAGEDADNLLFPRKDDETALGLDIVESIMKIDRSFGKKFLLKSYLSQKGDYSDSLMSSLDNLLKYQVYFDEPHVALTYYESNFQYNKELAEGLPERKHAYDFVAHHKESLSFEECTLKHLVFLFTYPVVKVRELTLKAVFDLVLKKQMYLRHLIRFGLKEGTDNQTEHCLVVLLAICIENPTMLLPFKEDLFALTNRDHFNILASVQELLLRLQRFDNNFLTSEEKMSILSLNAASPILLNQIVHPLQGKKFLYSEFQTDLLKEILDNEDADTEIQDDVYADLVSKDLGNYDGEKEGLVHQRYNINTNYDTIEIQSPYYDEVKGSINKVFASKVKTGCYEANFISDIKRKFRLYDPSKLIYKIVAKPKYINWIQPDLPEEEFIQYADFQGMINKFTEREKPYITIAEFGSQRLDEKHHQLQASTYFQVFAFLKKKGFNISGLKRGNKTATPALFQENLYGYELPSTNINSADFPIKEVKPLVEVSYNRFRGEVDVVSISLFSDIFTAFQIPQADLLKILRCEANNPVQAIRWQEAYSTGWRRYKPTSEGFTLKVERKRLIEFLAKNDMVLCYDISLQRSVTKYRPESYMEWHKLKKLVEVSSLFPQ